MTLDERLMEAFKAGIAFGITMDGPVNEHWLEEAKIPVDEVEAKQEQMAFNMWRRSIGADA